MTDKTQEKHLQDEQGLLATYFRWVAFILPRENEKHDPVWSSDKPRYRRYIDVDKKEVKVLEMAEDGHFKTLFPAKWLKDENLKREFEEWKGGPDVFRFFLEKEDEKYMAEFRSLTKKDIGIHKPILDRFYDLNISAQPVYKEGKNGKPSYGFEWQVPGIMHKSDTLYKAYEYYAHKQYTLALYGYELSCTVMDTDLTDFFKDFKNKNVAAFNKINGNDFLQGKEHFMEICGLSAMRDISLEKLYYSFYGAFNNTKKDDLAALGLEFIKGTLARNIDKMYHDPKLPELPGTYFNVIQKVLESTPQKESEYKPTGLEKLISQVKRQSSYTILKIYNRMEEQDPSKNPYSKSDIKNIKNYIEKVRVVLWEQDKKSFDDEVNTPDVFCKVDALYRKASEPAVRKSLGEDLYGKILDICYKKEVTSIDSPVGGDGEGPIIIADPRQNVEEGYRIKDKKDRYLSYCAEQFKDEEEYLKYLGDSWLPDIIKETEGWRTPQGKISLSVINKGSKIFTNYLEISGIPKQADFLFPVFRKKIQAIADKINDDLKKEEKD
jgi:hypothetical protein